MSPPEFTGYRFVYECADWQQAIHFCGQPLIDAELITTDYLDAIITETLATGPYYIISPGFALAHARPEQGVLTNQTCFSLLRLTQPVLFNNDEPVSLIIILAAGDGQQHTDAITRLLTWLDNGRLEQILQIRSQRELDAQLSE